MEEGRGGTESRVNRTMRDWQEKISFQKTLGSVAVSTLLTLPAKIWQQHGDKVQKFVILQSVSDRKMWTVKVQIYFPDKRPQVVFRGGWRSFVVDNDLVVGDRLKFTLTGRSKFQVVIRRRCGDLKVRPSVMRPKLMSKFSQRQANNSVARQDIEVIRKISVKSEKEMNGHFVKEAGTAEDSIAHSASNMVCEAPSESPSDMDSQFFEALEILSDMNSHFFEPSEFPSDRNSHFFESSEFPSDIEPHFFEPMLQKNEQEGALSQSFNDTLDCNHQSQNALPRFYKRIRGSNVLEIPCKFLRSHWTQIGTHAKLQGIHETSQVYTVMYTCVMNEGRPSLFFKSSCWDDFVKDNCLHRGQKLRFILTAHSSFVVRNAE